MKSKKPIPTILTTLFSDTASSNAQDAQIKLMCMPAISTSLIQPLVLMCFRAWKAFVQLVLYFSQRIQYFPYG